MTRPFPLATLLTLMLSHSLGKMIAAVPPPPPVEEKTENSWEFSLSTLTYFQQHARDYVNPNFTADHGWLHLEARYNYEALKTGSFWVGYNFERGKNLKLEIKPMVGGVFGDSTGIAPGYNISLSYQQFELSAQGEYFFDASKRANDFFYDWAEGSCSPTKWLRVGIVIERTQVLGADSDVRRGPFIGFKRDDKFDFTTYWLSPGSNESAFVFAVTVNF
jgi:hypothetical protein